MKKVLFGTTALAGALALAAPAVAGEISLPGALDLRISGTSDFEVEYADGDFQLGQIDSPVEDTFKATDRSWFFNQDHEIVFRATGVGDTTGITYGANLELELQTGDQASGGGGVNAQWDEAWAFIQGSWGEFRFGNEDAVTDVLKISANSVERGTGGLDGAGRVYARPTRLSDGGEATKIIYYTPEIAGFQAGVDYAINGDDSGSSRGLNNATSDHVDFGANWQGSFAGFDLGVFGGVSYFSNDEIGVDESSTNWMVGALFGIWGIDIAGAYWNNGDGSEGSLVDLDGDPLTQDEQLIGTIGNTDNAYNVAIGGEIAGVGLSFGYQHENTFVGSDIDTYVLSGDTGILPGVALRGDVAYVDGFRNENGVNAVVQLRVAF